MFRTTLDARSMFVGWSILLLVWCAASYVIAIPEYLLATPGKVLLYIKENVRTIAIATGLTASQAIVGWVFALIIGLISGAIVYYMPWGRRVVLPPLIALQTTPIIALAPLVTFWFGYGWLSKVIVACIVSMFPIVLATYSGLGEAKPTHIHLFRLVGVNEFLIFWHVRLRSAWMVVLPSLKTSGIFAVIGSIVAEFMGGNNGLGFFIMKSIYSSDGDLLITAVICSALLGQTFLIVLEKIVSPWEERWGTQ